MSVKSVYRPVYTEHDHERERGHCDFPRDFPLESLHEAPFKQNPVIRAVAATVCADMHYLMKMEANASDTDSDAILELYLFTRRRRRKRIYRGIYAHPILQKRHIYGKYHNLVKGLHFHPYKFHRVKPGPSSTKTKDMID